ncbi:hypothetical protein BCR33DRAFT_716327 [Rhizoclosmatium globosum]|uniref:Protein YOP1 n=1 Tax=Rhizoclosmatium globosum TaxID=329046 RepID=A0A1Y2CFV1_9FUNG|nr:hypothetical protein BCR33DRAFT_716327 [Rhizoclosmatium globosum]|eukprot:ORY45684.1 hypothetical protein BCR33DRAFT_716327 [Rhizoclosmatium globosum]
MLMGSHTQPQSHRIPLLIPVTSSKRIKEVDEEVDEAKPRTTSSLFGTLSRAFQSVAQSNKNEKRGKRRTSTFDIESDAIPGGFPLPFVTASSSSFGQPQSSASTYSPSLNDAWRKIHCRTPPCPTQSSNDSHTLPLLSYIYKQYDVPPLSQFIVLVLVGLSVFRRALQKNARFLSNVLGVAYPSLMSLLAVERPREKDEERLFTYCEDYFRMLSNIGSSIPQILALYPAYFTTKMSILYWLYAKDGALKVYRGLFRPLLVKVRFILIALRYIN